jgi:hypothetical protein
LPLLQQEIYFQKQACEKRKEKKERKKESSITKGRQRTKWRIR